MVLRETMPDCEGVTLLLLFVALLLLLLLLEEDAFEDRNECPPSFSSAFVSTARNLLAQQASGIKLPARDLLQPMRGRMVGMTHSS